MITRRNFIELFGLTAVAGLSLNSIGKTFAQSWQTDDLFLIPGESMSDPVFSFTSDRFTPFINSDFRIQQEGVRRSDVLRLIEVKDHQSKTNLQKGVQGASFSLLFYNRRATAEIPSRQVDFSHESFGTFRLLITPVGLQPNYYEAIINHLRQ